MRAAIALSLALVLSACGTLGTTVKPGFEADMQALRDMCATLGPVNLIPDASPE